MCEGDQPCCGTPWICLAEPLSRARAPNADGGAARSGLRAAQLQEAPPRAARRGPAKLRAVVRRLEGAPASANRAFSRRPTADLARGAGVAPRRRAARA